MLCQISRSRPQITSSELCQSALRSAPGKIVRTTAFNANPTWLWQIMPIVDKTIGKWYWSVNTTMDWGIHPTSLPPGTPQSVVSYYYRDVSPHGMTFGPAATLTYQPKPVFNFGIEYYGYWGEFGHFVNLHNQQQQFFPVVNLFVSPKWEINFGAGWGATASTDHLIVKVVLGRYFNWGKQKTPIRPHRAVICGAGNSSESVRCQETSFQKGTDCRNTLALRPDPQI